MHRVLALTIVSINLRVLSQMPRLGVHYPLAVATDILKQKFGGIEGLPTTMLYDRGGVLRMKLIGFEYTDNVESTLKPLL